MGDRKAPRPAPHEFHSDDDGQCCEQERGHPVHQRRPPPPPAPPRKLGDPVQLTTRQPDGFCLHDLVVNRFTPEPRQVMSVAGMRSWEGGRAVLCTWTELDGQAYHEWIPEGSLDMHRAKVAIPPLDVYLRHVRCGTPVSIAVLQHDVAHYVWCEACGDLVEDGELFPPVDTARVRLRVDRERVRPVEGVQTGETRATGDPLSDATDGRM